MTIGQLATTALLKGKSAQETLEIVKRVFPQAKTTMKCIYYYSSKAGIKLKKGSECNESELKNVLEMLG